MLYPGSQYVDWVGFSAFNHDLCMNTQEGGGVVENCPGDVVDPNLQSDITWSKNQGHPIIIAESAFQIPSGGQTTANFQTYLDRLFDLVENNDIHGLTYINSDWVAHNWQAPWGDSRVETNASVKNYWLSRANTSRYIHYSGGSNPTPTPINPTATPGSGDTIASDSFENGTGGGYGWNGSWSLSGQSVIVTNSSNSVDGTHHLRLRSANGLATRYVNMSGVSNGRLRFWWRANSFESGEEAYVRVNDGSGWSTIMTVVNGQDTNSWTYADLDISGYNMSSNFGIRFDSQMSSTGDQFRVDALTVVGNGGSTPSPTATPPPGGGNNIPGTLSNNVGSIGNNQTVSWNVNVTQSGNYVALISSNASVNSQLIDVTFNGTTMTQAIDSSQTISVYFFNVPAGSNTFSITARSNSVSIGSVVVNSN